MGTKSNKGKPGKYSRHDSSFLFYSPCFGFESRFQGGDDERLDGSSDRVVQRCGPEVNWSQAQGFSGPGDIGLSGRERVEGGESVWLVSPHRDARVERTANRDDLYGEFFRSRQS